MWNNFVSYLHTNLQPALQALLTIGRQHPTTTAGIALLFVLLGAMLAAEIADNRATATRGDEAPPM